MYLEPVSRKTLVVNSFPATSLSNSTGLMPLACPGPTYSSINLVVFNEDIIILEITQRN